MKNLLVVCFSLISTLGVSGVGSGKGKEVGTGEMGRERMESLADRKEVQAENQGKARCELSGRVGGGKGGDSRGTMLPSTVIQRRKREPRMLDQSINELKELILWNKSFWKVLDKEELDHSSRKASQGIVDALHTEITEVEEITSTAEQLLQLLQKRKMRLSQENPTGR